MTRNLGNGKHFQAPSKLAKTEMADQPDQQQDGKAAENESADDDGIEAGTAARADGRLSADPIMTTGAFAELHGGRTWCWNRRPLGSRVNGDTAFISAAKTPMDGLHFPAIGQIWQKMIARAKHRFLSMGKVSCRPQAQPVACLALPLRPRGAEAIR